MLLKISFVAFIGLTVFITQPCYGLGLNLGIGLNLLGVIFWLSYFLVKLNIFKANFNFIGQQSQPQPQTCGCGPETCESKKCGPLEMCTTCELTPCNTYSCFNPNGTNIACKFPCKETPPTCICKPNYRRESPGAPCTRIRCPPDGM